MTSEERGGATRRKGRAPTELRARGGRQQNYVQEEGANKIGQKLRAKPCDQPSDWLLPSNRYAYAHARTITMNTPSLQQTFSNASKRKRSSVRCFIVIKGGHLGF